MAWKQENRLRRSFILLRNYVSCFPVKFRDYVYFSSDQQQFSDQLFKRKLDSQALAQPPLKGSAAVNVLVEAIKHPGFTSEQLSGHLHKQGTKIKPEVIQSFFAFYGIEKKTSDLK